MSMRGIQKNIMMNKLKHALAFLMGMVYCWAVINCFSPNIPPSEASTATGIIALLITMFGGIFIIISVILFLIDNWNKE